MKKLLSTLFATLLSVALFADPIDLQKAENLASQYMVQGYSMNLVNKAIRSKANKVSAVVGKTAPYYVFSRGENQGYVIVAGDDCLPQILGYTEEGNFDESNIAPGLQYMLDAWQQSIETAQESQQNTPLKAHKAPALTANRENIAPLTTSHWHQSGPYNDICPTRDDNGARSMTGCVATAISQILYYWRKDLPATLQATTPTYGMDGYSHASVTRSIPQGTPMKWDLMLDSYNNAPSEYNEAVATMVFAVGAAAHLEYSIESGTATSGHIEDIPKAISNYFGMNGGWVAYRSSYSQEAWTQLIYDELAKGYPVMYTGVHPTSGGHAVYIDGYQKNNDLMHFNFGWGGQSDGYYTTTLETGMNGFNDYQSCLINAYPKKWNIKASISTPVHTYCNIDNDIKVTIENNSTLDFKGVYCFASTSISKPSKLTNAHSSDEITVIEKGVSKVLTLRVKPATVNKYYVTVTDENLNVLAQIPVEVEKTDVALSVNNIEALGSDETETVDENTFVKVYNTKAMVNAYVANTAKATYGGQAKINVYTSTDGGVTFDLYKSPVNTSVVIPAGGETCISFSVTGLTEGQYYYAEVNPEWGSSTNKTLVDNTESYRCYFKCAGSTNLTATLKEGTLSFSGKWDPTQYEALVGRTSNKTATSYDLTNVENVGFVPVVDYPMQNALVYANANVTGSNVVTADNVSNNINIIAGYGFLAKGDITLRGRATFNINQEPARWYMTTVPFSVDVPMGMLAYEITSHLTTTSGISNKATKVTKLEGGKSYLIMTSSKQCQELVSSLAENTLKGAPQVNTDESFIGIYTDTEVASGSKIVKDKTVDDQYFTHTNGEVVEAFRGYFYDSKMANNLLNFRAYPKNSLDPLYVALAHNIQSMYDIVHELGEIVTDRANDIMLDSIANAEKVFSLQSYTTTSIKNYNEAIKTWIEEYKTMLREDVNLEIDMTAQIQNPSFESSTTSVKGWTQSVASTAQIRQNSSLSYKTVYGDGANFLYGRTGAAVTQKLSLTPGHYRLSAMLGSDEVNSITLFAGSQEVTVKAHSFGKHYLTEAVIEDIVVDETGELTIGVKASNWFNADDFKLVFTGSSEFTSVDQIEQNEVNTQSGIYTLSGTRLDKVTSPGVYIIGGKRVFFK